MDILIPTDNLIYDRDIMSIERVWYTDESRQLGWDLNVRSAVTIYSRVSPSTKNVFSCMSISAVNTSYTWSAFHRILFYMKFN